MGGLLGGTVGSMVEDPPDLYIEIDSNQIMF